MNPIGMGVATAMYLSGKGGATTPTETAVEGFLYLVGVIVIIRVAIWVLKRGGIK